ncbi:ion channel [Catellatospora sp. NPDC049111]|uniref:ion channel n=1 Tax=Catellatospora sp. NPDC049111 TaxID=3155271 RepID=UPI003401480E
MLFFAPADYLIAVNASGQFVDLSSHIDALYFALPTPATVAFGDVHVQGQLVRSLLCVQMLFNAVVISTGLSVLPKQIGSWVRRRPSA